MSRLNLSSRLQTRLKMSELNDILATTAVIAYKQGVESERERIDGILDSWEVSLCKCDVCKSIKAIRAEIKGEENE